MHKTLVSMLLMAMAGIANATDVTCKVIGVYDGDTLTCLTEAKKQIKVRLAEIDTPEKAQPYGTKSQQALSSLVFGKQVQLNVQETDRYGRSVARIYT